MKLLRLASTINPTSAPYNQFALGFKDNTEQTFCSLYQNDILIDPSIRVLDGSGSILKTITLLKKALRDNTFDVIHIHSGLMGAIFFISIFPFKLPLLRKTIFTLHNSWHVLKKRNQYLNIFIMLLVKNICTCGLASRNSIPASLNFFISHKTKPIVNGFDNERIDYIKKNTPYQPHFEQNSRLKILCVGALITTKNQLALLQAIERCNLDAEVIFLGNGDKREELINYSNSLSASTSIEFKGRVSRNKTIEHMLQADISISLSKGEGLPIAVLESMYAGCFLILSDILPHKEIAPPEERSISIDLSESHEIDKALEFVISNIDQIRANRDVSKDYASSKFGMKHMLSGYMDIYTSYLKT